MPADNTGQVANVARNKNNPTQSTVDNPLTLNPDPRAFSTGFLIFFIASYLCHHMSDVSDRPFGEDNPFCTQHTTLNHPH